MRLFLVLLSFPGLAWARAADHALVLQTAVGTQDGAVAAMRVVAFGVIPSADLRPQPRKHALDIWGGLPPEQPRRIGRPAPCLSRSSIPASAPSARWCCRPRAAIISSVRTMAHGRSSPGVGIAAVRRIDERANHHSGSERSYTFHGRDICRYRRTAGGRQDRSRRSGRCSRRRWSPALRASRPRGRRLRGSIPPSISIMATCNQHPQRSSRAETAVRRPAAHHPPRRPRGLPRAALCAHVRRRPQAPPLYQQPTRRRLSPELTPPSATAWVPVAVVGADRTGAMAPNAAAPISSGFLFHLDRVQERSPPRQGRAA